MWLADLGEQAALPVTTELSTYSARCRCLGALLSVGSHGQLRGERKSKAWGLGACTRGWGLCACAQGLWAVSVPKGRVTKGCWQVSSTAGHSWTSLSSWSWQEGTGEVGEASQYRLELGCLPAADNALHAISPSRVSVQVSPMLCEQLCPVPLPVHVPHLQCMCPHSQCTSRGHQTPPQIPGQGGWEPPRMGSSKCFLQQWMQSQEIPLLRRQHSALPRECVWMKLEPAMKHWPGFPRGSCAVPRALGWELLWGFFGGSHSPAGSQPLSCPDPLGAVPALRGSSQPILQSPPFPSTPQWGCARRAHPMSTHEFVGDTRALWGDTRSPGDNRDCGVTPKIHEVIRGLSHRSPGQSCAHWVPGGCWQCLGV